ncbi:M15 family metallopeptidase [Clostridium sp. P21]|uniref:M15 family metallopeptidase n=1 Tax=Clostridium muellerianum TaxID=2716538 RepID=A0A7Y0EIY0_9CLOT|nr:M15 family metallopeptidase [Clostridium muellerianum]NMM64252.1 M15 family metallopeptidase [Clostridium muellerianum]
MKKTLIYIITFFLLVNSTCGVKASAISTNVTGISVNEYDIKMKQDLLCLMMAYPEYIKDIKCDDNNYVYLIMKSGRKILYDDKKVKTPEEKLGNADLQDTMEQIYPLTSISKLMDKNYDPGRYRSYDLLKEVYGSSRQQIEGNLKSVNLKYTHVLFNNNNKAAESLQSTMQNLIPLLKENESVRRCLFPCMGTFNYRLVAGTNRLSPHSFGIAIDLASDKRDYWKWSSPKAGEERLNSYSKEIVEAFEKNNFIWGGKWGHFDILHFEYRPEIILKAKYFTNVNDDKSPWYNGVNLEDASIKEYIDKINQSLK